MDVSKDSKFEVSREELIRELQSWWDEESLSFDDAVSGGPPATAASDDGLGKLPVVDSKAVVKASPIVERILGKKLPPKLIRRGGYFSFDDFLEHMLPKLKELSDGVAPEPIQTNQ